MLKFNNCNKKIIVSTINQEMSAGKAIASSVIASIQPSRYGKNIECQGDWPLDATIGIEYEIFNRGMDNRSGGKRIKLFKSEEEYREWKVEQQNWVADCEWNFSIHIKVYEWDLGPKYITMEYI